MIIRRLNADKTMSIGRSTLKRVVSGDSGKGVGRERGGGGGAAGEMHCIDGAQHTFGHLL